MRAACSRLILIAGLCLLPATQALADCTDDSWLGRKCLRIREAWDKGRNDLYLPFLAHHGRDTYTPQRISELNEDAYGIGYGRSIVTDRGRFRDDWDGIYAMGFRDSHRQLQLMAGYAYQTYLGTETINLGIGYTVALTSRRDIAGGFPVPVVLPMASINYRDFSLMGAYVPRLSGHQGNGDVLFLFGHVSF